MNRATPCSGLDTVWIDKGLHVATKIRQAPQTATSSEMLQQATSFVARAQLSAASRSVRDASRDFSATRSEEHTSELQSLMRISYAVFCLKKKNKTNDKSTSVIVCNSQQSTAEN